MFRVFRHREYPAPIRPLEILLANIAFYSVGNLFPEVFAFPGGTARPAPLALTAQDEVPHHEDALLLGIHNEIAAVNDFHRI
jgi:hypothetical protein